MGERPSTHKVLYGPRPAESLEAKSQAARDEGSLIIRRYPRATKTTKRPYGGYGEYGGRLGEQGRV